MPMLAKGVYANTRDQAYEKESCYFIGFQITSALASIEFIFKEQIDTSFFENKYQYYHFYCDHLIYSMGQITNRFIDNKRGDNEIDAERKKWNRINFFFDEHRFPTLSDKRARNMIEHIDEYNNKSILNEKGVGGFNVIEEESDVEFIKSVTNKYHLYTLDLISKKIYLVKGKEKIIIDIDELKNELLNLKKNATDFHEMIYNMWK